MENLSPNAVMIPTTRKNIAEYCLYRRKCRSNVLVRIERLFLKIGVPFILISRNSMLFLTEKTLKKIQKNNLKLEDFFDNYSEVMKSKLLSDLELLELIKSEEEIKSTFDLLKENLRLRIKLSLKFSRY